MDEDLKQDTDNQDDHEDDQSAQDTANEDGQDGKFKDKEGKADASKEDAGDEKSGKGDEAFKWNDGWQEEIAKHRSAGDPKIYERELKRIKERYADPAAIYGSSRELENMMSSGGLVKIPTDKSSEKEVAAYRAANNVPAEAKDYYDTLKLENGVEIGDADKPIIDSILPILHESHASPEAANKLLNWYYDGMENAAADLDDKDEETRGETSKTLKEEFGVEYRRLGNGLGQLFAEAPGGSDVKNPEALIARLLGGRTSDGVLIGDDPDAWRFLAGLGKRRGLGLTDPGGAPATGQSIAAELKEIEGVMRADRTAYNKDEKMQARYRELLDFQIANAERK